MPRRSEKKASSRTGSDPRLNVQMPLGKSGGPLGVGVCVMLAPIAITEPSGIGMPERMNTPLL